MVREQTKNLEEKLLGESLNFAALRDNSFNRGNKMKKKLQFKSVKARLTFWFLVVALVPLLIMSAVISYQRVNAIKALEFSKLTAIRDFKVDQVNNWLDERIGDIQTISEAFEIRALEQLMHKEEQPQNHTRMILTGEGLLNRYVENYKAYDELFIINPDGGKIIISTNKTLIGEERSHDPYFTEPMRTGKTYIKDIYYSQTLNEPAMAFSIPIFCASHGKHIVGILVAEVNLEHSLYDLLLERTSMGKTGETLIVNKTLIALNQLRWYERAPLKLKIHAKPALLAGMGKTGIVEATDYRGEEVLAAYSYIPRTQWGFVAKQDLKEVYAPIRSMLWGILILFAISAVVVYGLALFLARSIARPVKELAEISKRIASGDLSARNRVTGADEFGFLAQSFNTMADSVKSQMAIKETSAEIATTMVAAKALDDFRKNILKKLVEVTDSNMGAYFLHNPENNTFEHFTSTGISPEILEPFDASMLEGELGQALETKRISYVKNIPGDTLFTFKTFTGTALPKEIITIPIVIDGVVVSIISLANLNVYSQESLEIVNQVWVGMNTGVSNLRANAETARLAAELIEKKYLVDSSSSAIGTCTLDGIMTYVNPSFLETWGFEDDSEVLGKPFPEFWMVSEIFDEVMGDLKDKGTWSGEIKAKKKDGTLFDVQASASTVYDETGKPIELMSSSINISDRKKAEKEILEINQELQAQAEELQSQTEELQQQSEELQEQNVELEAQREQVEEANRLKSEFLSNMSHELRTPLNSVMALSRVLLVQAKDKLSEEELNYLEIIQRNGQNLLSLINDILDLSKIEAGKMDVTPKLFSIASTIETIVERLDPVAEEKGIAMNQEIADNLPQVESDEARVHQIVQNLIGNALKFTDQGSVTVSARSDAEKIYIRVADTGIGISAKDLSQIFQEFRQVDGTSARPYEGTGLGLAIAHKAAKMLGGDLTVQSALGKGSTFTLILPVKWSGLIPASGPLAVTKPWQITPAQKTVLVVDDDPEVLTMISGYLSLEGYNILTATSGEKALRLAREHRPFAITLDVIMPEMDGWEVLQHLKENPGTKNIPVIIVSVSDDKETGFALGAVGYVTKPVNRDLLVGEINRIDGPTPHTIMVVDDNEIERKEMAGIIEEEGMKALVAEDGKRCMDMIQASLPDVLVLDLIMPDMDGFEVLDRVRSDPGTKNLPVIVVTAKDLTTEDRERLSGNVSSVLAKGDTTSKTLLEELKKLLSEIERPQEYLQAEKVESGNRILLVEDNEAAVIQVKSILESEGYSVDVARGGQEALEYVEKTIPDGIILDLMMPQVDGFEVLNKLRSRKATAMIPVLVLTAKDLTPEDLNKLTANNIQQLIQKGGVDREGLLFRTRLMLGVGFETGNLKLETEKPERATRNPQLAKMVEKTPTLLVVEDNPDNMTTIKAILKDNYNILEATDGEEGLKMALSELPDLVLLDMSLPKMDGFEVVGKLKGGKDTMHIPVIALTARAMKGDRERTIDAGCDDYVSKPVDPEKLIWKIGEWVKSET